MIQKLLSLLGVKPKCDHIWKDTDQEHLRNERIYGMGYHQIAHYRVIAQHRTCIRCGEKQVEEIYVRTLRPSSP